MVLRRWHVHPLLELRVRLLDFLFPIVPLLSFPVHRPLSPPRMQHAILWVTDFPMFEWNEEEQRAEVRGNHSESLRPVHVPAASPC